MTSKHGDFQPRTKSTFCENSHIFTVYTHQRIFDQMCVFSCRKLHCVFSLKDLFVVPTITHSNAPNTLLSRNITSPPYTALCGLKSQKWNEVLQSNTMFHRLRNNNSVVGFLMTLYLRRSWPQTGFAKANPLTWYMSMELEWGRRSKEGREVISYF